MATRPDLELLVHRARDGDGAAWEALYRSLYPRLLAYARTQLDADRALDAVSEAMARAVAAIERFEWKGAGFEAWLFGILRHVVVDTHRQLGRRSRMTLVVPRPTEDEAADRLIFEDEASALRVAFAQLSGEDRELLHLRVVSGLSSEETAAVLGKRPGAVRMAQVRALARLRELLGEVEP